MDLFSLAVDFQHCELKNDPVDKGKNLDGVSVGFQILF